MTAIPSPKIVPAVEIKAVEQPSAQVTRPTAKSPMTPTPFKDPRPTGLTIRLMQLECDGVRPQLALLEPGTRYVFGRSRGCDVVFRSDIVSRRHAELWQGTDQRWYVRDLKSCNGTFLVVGEAVVPVGIAPVPVEAGQLLLLGGTATRVTFLAEVPPSPAAFIGTPAPAA